MVERDIHLDLLAQWNQIRFAFLAFASDRYPRAFHAQFIGRKAELFDVDSSVNHPTLLPDLVEWFSRGIEFLVCLIDRIAKPQNMFFVLALQRFFQVVGEGG